MSKQKSPEGLAKFLDYALGRRPDEFGLVPDPEGYVKIKDLLKALSEEPGWKHVRRASLEEVILTRPDPPVEIEENRIRARNRDNLLERKIVQEFPKLLYTCVRKKAHPVVVDRGVSPMGERENVILSSDPELAGRMGRRIDPAPVMLTVHTQNAIDSGVLFQQIGEILFLAPYLPADCFTAPPLPKEQEVPAKKAKKKAEAEPEKRSRTPGSFMLDTDFMDPAQKKQNRHVKKKKDLKRDQDRKQRRKQKQNMWPE